MNITSRLHNKASMFLGRLLSVSLSVWMLGAIYTPALAAVTVDPAPLTVQASLPPNITLMLDDSGSMAWNFMPDWSSLKNNTNNDALINANNNGVYYDPTVTYVAPPKANSTTAVPNFYANQTNITSTPVNGFATTLNKVDLTSYNGNLDFKSCGSGVCSGSAITLSTVLVDNVSSVVATSYAPTLACKNGDDLQSNGTCEHDNGKKAKPRYTYYSSNPTCKSGDTYNASTQLCNGSETVITPNYYNAFQYSTGPANGTYVVHYVVDAGAHTDCGGLSNCVISSDTSGTSAPSGVAVGQNVANWFAYYHTRLLMAKSGLMNSFIAVDPTFRVGFGSINGNNDNKLPTDIATQNSTNIAQVKALGDGSSSSQKANFWNWLAGETATGSTPLRVALDAVGRYYQTQQPWLSPDPNSTSGGTVELACRQSYTILTTDGFWNGASGGVGNADNPSTKPTIKGPNGQSYTYTPAAPYADSWSDTLADVAMKYWITDLRPALANEVPPSTEDPAFWQHMSTFTLGLGFLPTGIAPSATTIDQIFTWANGGSSAIAGFSWPKPAADSTNNIADLAHAAVNGHGGFYSATSPDSFTSGLKSALLRAQERVGTGASLAANSTQLKTGTFAYQANYYTSKWKGDLKAYAINATTGALYPTPTWTASSVLPAFGSRTIHTFNKDKAAGSQDVTFPTATAPAVPAGSDLLAVLSTAEQGALGSTATSQATMISYLLGDSSLEKTSARPTGIYRPRDTAFGDVVDSQPVYVGAPDPNQFNGQKFTGTTSFATYASTAYSEASKPPLIFVAANDGMLHALNANTGAETYAYLPAAVIVDANLKQLADTDYGATTGKPHQYFNDGELTVADAYFGATPAWHTVAVGTTGRGLAKAVYALDVTDPTNIKLLWERSALDGNSDGNSKYIGQMTGKPVIAQVGDGQWAVLMGNGYNSTAGTAALLQFSLADGSLTVHATDASADNGLAAPAVWLGDPTNGVSTVAYAGDLLGRVWSFSLNTGSTSTTSTPSAAGTILFKATDAAGKAQPITGGMLAGKDPATSNVWLFFGTGKYLNSGDVSNSDVQSWYGLIIQSPSTTTLVVNGGQRDSSTSPLVQRSIVAETAGVVGVTADPTATPPVVGVAAVSPARAVTAAGTLPAANAGWYMDLKSPTSSTASDGTVTYTPNATAKGERMVTPNLFQGSLLIGTTRIPTATDACNPSGSGWIMAIDPFTGTSPRSNFFDINGSGSINSSDSISTGTGSLVNSGVGFSSLPNNPIFVGSTMLVSFDNGTTGNYATSGSGGQVQRVSWRELINQ